MTPQGFGLQFHHLGLAVTQPKQTVRFLDRLGYAIGSEIYDPRQNVNLIWCTHPSMPAVEVISSTDQPGPLDSYLKHFTEIIYHIGYQTRDVESSLKAMEDAGHRIICISHPKPSILFGESEVSFYMAKGFGLIELIQSECPSTEYV